MIIELFSGIGRFQTDETVIYISNDIRTKPTICADVRFLPIKKGTKNATTNLYYSSKKQMFRAELNKNVRDFMLGLL